MRVWFSLGLDARIAFAGAEEAWLKLTIGRSVARKARVTSVIESLRPDTFGKRRNLKGTTRHSLAGVSDEPEEIKGAEAAPMRYKLVMTALPAELVEELCESIDLDIREQHHLVEG